MNKSIIYARVFDRYYKLLDLIIRNDESIYIYFPRKKGYLIKNSQNIDLEGKSTKSISFKKNMEQNIFNPYLSFHPGKGTVHVNAQDIHKKEIHFLKDRPSHKLDVLSFDAVDIPYKNNLIVNVPTRNPQALSIDVLVHRKGGYIDKDDLPLARIRNLAFICRLNDNLSKTLTYSLTFNNVIDNGKALSREIVAFIWNKSTPFSFCLSSVK